MPHRKDMKIVDFTGILPKEGQKNHFTASVSAGKWSQGANLFWQQGLGKEASL